MPVTAQTVPPAQLRGKLTNQAIEACAGIADRIEAEAVVDLTEADAALVLATFGPMARELRQWRLKGDLIRDLVGDNVLLFPGAR